jgi:hypothetical protein
VPLGWGAPAEGSPARGSRFGAGGASPEDELARGRAGTGGLGAEETAARGGTRSAGGPGSRSASGPAGARGGTAGMAEESAMGRGASGMTEAEAAGRGGAGGPMGGARGRGEDDHEHHRPEYLVETEDVFGDDRRVAPPVIGGLPPQ